MAAIHRELHIPPAQRIQALAQIVILLLLLLSLLLLLLLHIIIVIIIAIITYYYCYYYCYYLLLGNHFLQIAIGHILGGFQAVGDTLGRVD